MDISKDLIALSKDTENLPAPDLWGRLEQVTVLYDQIKVVKQRMEDLIVSKMMREQAKWFLSKEGKTVNLKAIPTYKYDLDTLEEILHRELGADMANKVILYEPKVDRREFKKVIDLGGTVAEQVKKCELPTQTRYKLEVK